MERKRLMFEGKPVYVYSFGDGECSIDLWSTREVGIEELTTALLEINETIKKNDLARHETIWSREAEAVIANPDYDPSTEGKPWVDWTDLLREKFGMERFSIDISGWEPHGWDDCDYDPKLKKVQPEDYRY